MRHLTRMALLVIVAMVAVSIVSAQGRPQCGTLVRNGTCFFDDDGAMIAVTNVDAEGDAVAAWWSSNDFVQVRPDGSVFGLGTDVEAELWVCPATAGGWDCILEFYVTQQPPPGMLFGSGKLNAAGLLEPVPCPWNEQIDGVAFDDSGSGFAISSSEIRLKDHGSDGCRTLVQEVAISAAD